MALQIVTTTKHGIVLNQAYAKITSFSGNKQEIHYNVDMYASAADRLSLRPAVDTFDFCYQIQPDMGPVLPALYAHLKTTDQCKNGLDV